MIRLHRMMSVLCRYAFQVDCMHPVTLHNLHRYMEILTKPERISCCAHDWCIMTIKSAKLTNEREENYKMQQQRKPMLECL